MSKTKQYIFILVAVLAVLGAALYFILQTPEVVEDTFVDSGTYEELETTQILDIDLSRIASVSVKNEVDEFNILVSEEVLTQEVDGETVESVEYNYTIEGYESFHLNEIMLETAVTGLSVFTSNKELGEVEDLSLYGLEPAKSTITMTLTDGTVLELLMGDTAGETSGSYVLYEGNVYIADMNTSFLNSVESCGVNYQVDIVSYETEDGTAYDQIEKLAISGTAFETPIDIAYDEEKMEYLMISHKGEEVSLSAMDEYLSTFLSMASSTVERYNPSDEELEVYGLLNPVATVNFTINGVDYSVSLGNKSDSGAYYMYEEDNKTAIYTLPATTAEQFINTDYLSLRSTYVYLPQIEDVSALSIDMDGVKSEITIESEISEELSTETQTAYEHTVTLNGEEIIYQNLTAFYLDIISVPVLNAEQSSYGDTPRIKIEFTYLDGSVDILEYYVSQEDASRAIAVLNGEYYITARTEDVEKLIETYEEFVSG